MLRFDSKTGKVIDGEVAPVAAPGISRQISDLHKAGVYSGETRENIAKTLKNKAKIHLNKGSHIGVKSTHQTGSVVKFTSLSQASRFFRVTRQTIHNRIGSGKSYGGWVLERDLKNPDGNAPSPDIGS